MAQRTRSRERLFLLTALGSGGTEILILSVMTNQLIHDSSGVMAALVYIFSLIGVSLMGLVGGILLNAITNRLIGISSSVLCAVLCLVSIGFQGIWTDMLLTGMVSFFSALGGPNVTATYARMLGANRASGMAKYQSFSISIAVGAPILGAFLISAEQTKWALIIASLLHLASVIPWLTILGERCTTQKITGRLWNTAAIGYRCIFSIPALRLMTISRLLNNLLYIGLPVSLPLVIGTMHLEAADAAWTQASGVSSIRIGALIGGATLAWLLTKRADLARMLPVQTLTFGILAITLLCIARDPIIIVCACVVAGVGQFSFRLTGTTFGPAVTPSSQLAHVILAGDTVVRLFSAIYGLSLVALVGVTGQPAYTLLFLSALALPSARLMRPAVDKHFQAVKEESRNNAEKDAF